MRSFKDLLSRWFVFLAVAVVCGTPASRASAEWVSLPAVRDTTLYQYDPNDPSSLFNGNGKGNFFSGGRTYKRSQIRRGLIGFDFSGIPAGASLVPGSGRLDLYVVDVPKKDESQRPFWLVPLAGLGQQWGEGASRADAGISGAGSGAPAEKDDATWFHTKYDPAEHDQTTFNPHAFGFWSQQGALGGAPLDPAPYGPPTGVVPSEIGPVSFSSAGMEADVGRWLQDPSSNFGWIVLGDETIESDTASSNRGFASREHANPDFRPRLTFEYVPEPSCTVLLACAAAVLLWWRRCRSQ